MQDVTLQELILGGTGFESGYAKLRSIEHEYHLALTAKGRKPAREFEAARRLSETRRALKALAASEENAQDEIIRVSLLSLEAAYSNCVETGKTFTESQRALSDIVREELEEFSASIIERSNNSRQTYSLVPSKKPIIKTALRAEKQFLAGAAQSGIDRNEAFNEALISYRELVEDPSFTECPAVWLQYGFLLWKHKPNLAEASDCFRRAIELLGTRPKLAALALRQLAHIQYLGKDYSTAINLALKAVPLDRNPAAYLECARYATLGGAHDRAIKILKKGLDQHPDLIAGLYSEPELEQLGPAREQLVTHAAEGIKRECIDKMSSCQRILQSIDHVLESVNRKVRLNSKSMFNAEEIAKELCNRDLAMYWRTREKIEKTERDSISYGRSELHHELTDRQEVVQSVKDSLAALWNERETGISDSVRKKEEELAQIRHERAKMDKEWESRSGCGFGLIGAGLSALFYVASVIIGKVGGASADSFRGITIIAGIMLAASIGIPFALQVVYGIQRSVMEMEFAARERAVLQTSEKEQKEHDHLYQKRLPDVRERLEKAMADLKVVENAFLELKRQTGTPVPPSANAA